MARSPVVYRRAYLLVSDMDRVLVYCGLGRGRRFLRMLRRRYSRVVGFDAIPDFVNKLQRRFSRRPHIELVHAALGEQSGGVVDFYIYVRGGSHRGASSRSRLSKAFLDNWAERWGGREISLERVIEVPSVNLMDFLDSRGIDRVDRLITDLQGADLAVLCTIRPMLCEGRVRAITCEVESDDLEGYAYPDLASNKQRDFAQFFSDLPYAGKGRHSWDLAKIGVHQDLTWKVK